jgi:hypothetical protein
VEFLERAEGTRACLTLNLHRDPVHSRCDATRDCLDSLKAQTHRPFRSGTPFVDYRVAGVDSLFHSGRDWWLASDMQGMLKLCDHLLSLSQAERLRLGGCAREHILTFHTQYHSCREMVDIVRGLRAARACGTTAPRPQLSFLRQETTPALAYPVAVVNWQG